LERLRSRKGSEEGEKTSRRVVQLRRYEEVEPTNNLAERALRPEVVFRKIIGGHRSWSGAQKHDILRSILATCKLRGENFMGFLEEQYEKSITSET